MIQKISFILAGCLAFICVPVQADYLLTEAGSGTPGFSAGNNTLGYSFTVRSSPLQVSALGLWDYGADGLLNAHEVGLWDMSGTLLASVRVPSGTAAFLAGEFRYAPLTAPVVLDAAQSYVLGVRYPYDMDPDELRDFFLPSTPAFYPAVTPGFWRWIQDAGFTFPVNVYDGGSAAVGPSMEFVVVPEPGVGALSLAGGLVLGLWRGLRRRAR